MPDYADLWATAADVRAAVCEWPDWLAPYLGIFDEELARSPKPRRQLGLAELLRGVHAAAPPPELDTLTRWLGERGWSWSNVQAGQYPPHRGPDWSWKLSANLEAIRAQHVAWAAIDEERARLAALAESAVPDIAPEAQTMDREEPTTSRF